MEYSSTQSHIQDGLWLCNTWPSATRDSDLVQGVINNISVANTVGCPLVFLPLLALEFVFIWVHSSLAKRLFPSLSLATRHGHGIMSWPMKSSRFPGRLPLKEEMCPVFSLLYSSNLEWMQWLESQQLSWTLRQHIKDRETPVKGAWVPDGRGEFADCYNKLNSGISFMLKRETNFCLILSHCYLGRFYYMHLNLFCLIYAIY